MVWRRCIRNVYWVCLHKLWRSVCINYEELRGTEYESDSDIHSDSDEEYFSLAQKHNQILRHLQAIIIYCMKVIKPQWQCTLLCTFLCFIGAVRPNYLNFSKPYNFENRITKTLTFKTAVPLEEYILSRDLLIFFQEDCILIKTSDFKELVLNSFT